MKCSQEIFDLLSTLYGFSPSESEVLTLLCEEDSMRVDEMAEKLGKDRSTVQRYVSKLNASGLLKRRSVSAENGRGRFYEYFIDKKSVKKRVKRRLDAWTEDKLEKLENL